MRREADDEIEELDGGDAMQWDLGVRGLLYLTMVSMLFGAVVGLVVQGSRERRIKAAWITTSACSAVGLLVSEGLFGWATEEDLQPNIDGLSRDEVMLAGALTSLLVVLLFRLLARHPRRARRETRETRETPAHRR